MKKKFILSTTIVIVILIVLALIINFIQSKGYFGIYADNSGAGINATIGKNFTIDKNQTALIDSEKLTLYIAEINDNRCSLEVMCFYPGTVNIKLNIVKNGRLVGQLNFSSYTDLEQKLDVLTSAKSKNIGNYKVYLTDIGKQAYNNDTNNLSATFNISKFGQGVAKDMIFKTELPIIGAKVLTTYKDSNVYIDEFNIKANDNSTISYQYITTSQSEKLYFKANKYLSQKKDYSFKDTNSITFDFTNLLIGDLSEDDTINSLDWSLMNQYWQQSNTNYDLTGDKVVNSLDWSLMNRNWGKQGHAIIDGWQMYLNGR